MTNAALRSRLPSSGQVTARAGQAVAVGATLVVLGESVRFGALSAAGFLGLRLAGDAAEAIVGDYADNALLGLLFLAGSGYLLAVGTIHPVAVAGALGGGWLLLDGVQHLRHGVARDDPKPDPPLGGSLVAGILGALLGRLLEPVRL